MKDDKLMFAKQPLSNLRLWLNGTGGLFQMNKQRICFKMKDSNTISSHKKRKQMSKNQF